jgi:alkylated DNA repair dioxygenase AlkB
MGTYTITFGECCENYVRMQQIGTLADNGFSIADLKKAQKMFDGYITEYIDLERQDTPEAAVLIIRNGLLAMGVNPDSFYDEQAKLDYDKQKLMYKRVVNSIARHNLCFADSPQTANIEKGQGTIIAFNSLPLLNETRKALAKFFGPKAKNLNAEGNYYYDCTKCYIGFHGDTERKKVIAVRLGNKFPLFYQWYYKNNPVGDKIKIELEHGDVYIMSEKAVGQDWKKSSIYTLRHAAGYPME